MADNRFGGYSNFSGGAASQASSQQGYANPNNPNYNWYSRQQKGIAEREAATKARIQREKQLEAISPAARERYAESVQEGDVAFGSLGRNVPKDTRLAQAFAAMGVNEDFMRALVAASQLAPGSNR